MANDRVQLAWQGGTPESLAATFEKYAQENGRDIKELTAHQSTQLADDLFKATYKADASDIRAVQKVAIPPEMRAKWKGLSGVQMRQRMIALRVGRRGALRSGWIPAMVALGSRMNVAIGKRRKFAGSVERITGNLNAKTTIINSTPGIVILDERDLIVQKAIQMRIDDMNTYIQRKIRERSTIFNPTGA